MARAFLNGRPIQLPDDKDPEQSELWRQRLAKGLPVDELFRLVIPFHAGQYMAVQPNLDRDSDLFRRAGFRYLHLYGRVWQVHAHGLTYHVMVGRDECPPPPSPHITKAM